MPDPVAEAAAITIAATLGTAPLMALHFQQVSLAALPANLLAAPAIAPVMWLGVLASRGGAGRGAAGHAVLGADRAAARLRPAGRARDGRDAARRWSSCSVVAGRDRRRLARRWPRSPASRCGAGGATRGRSRAAATAGWWLAVPLGRVGRALRGAPAAAARPPAPGELVISFLDIGQGDATLIQLDGTAVLVDTGPPDGPILTRLEGGRDRAPRRADAHPRGDRPRGRGGRGDPRLRAAAGRRRRRRLAVAASSGRSRRSPTRIHAPAAGEVITLGALRFRVLWPPPRAAGVARDREPERQRARHPPGGERPVGAADRGRGERRARAAGARSRSTC